MKTLRRRLYLAMTIALTAVFLGACASVPAPLPTLTFEELGFWWTTTPGAPLDTLSTLHMEFTFQNTTAVTLEFTGDGGGADPADELQIWAVPSVADPAVTFTSFPEGSYPVGARMSWEILVDLTTVATGDTGIAIRPQTSATGTLGPGEVALLSSTLTLER